MEAWKVSLHSGHSSDYCDHADDTLRDMIDAAVAFGYRTFGVTEHVPRFGARYLYTKELELGWTVETNRDHFARYTQDLQPLVAEYADRGLTILRGFEAEIVPPDEYQSIMLGYRDEKLPNGRPAFDYFVGSVHFINGHSIDGPRELFEQAIESCGGVAELVQEYYRQVAFMVETLQPDMVGHFDLIKLNLLRNPDFGYPNILNEHERRRCLDAGQAALETVRARNGILDLNTAGWRKNLNEPYPSAYWTEQAKLLGVPFCFGDDSHRVSDVGAGIVAARQYLLDHGIDSITVLARKGDSANGPVVRRVIPLG